MGYRSVAVKNILISILFALALWTKETSIALFGFCITGIVLSIVLGKSGKVVEYTALVKEYLYFLLTIFIGLCIAKAPYFIFPAKDVGANYTDYPITLKLIGDNLFFYVQQQPDVIIFGVLALIYLAVAGRRLIFNSKATDQFKIRSYIFMVSLCAMAWAYYLVLLIWRWPMAYYMLLPALIFKLCIVYGIHITNVYGQIIKPIRIVLYGVMSLCILYATFYIYYISSSQITYSRIYREALQKYIDAPGEKGSLVMESYPFYAEQIQATEQLPLVDSKVKLSVKGIADVLDPAVNSNIDIMRLLNVTQSKLDENVSNLPKQGDYLLVITGNKLATWFLRGVTPYYSEDSILKMQGAYDLKLIADKQIKMPALYLHTWTNKLVIEDTSIGYKLYKAVSDGPKFIWRGRYPDGWIGNQASLQVNTIYHRPVVIKLSAPHFALPNKVTISKDGLFFKE